MTNLKVRHLNGEVVELNLEKDKIYVDDQNKIVYFKFGDDENGVMQYKELGFKDVCTTPQSIVLTMVFMQLLQELSNLMMAQT